MSISMDNGFAYDLNGLQQLKNTAGQDPSKGLKEASKQFEAYFLTQMLKTMRATIPKSPLDSSATEMYTEMLDAQLAQKMASRGMGLAEQIQRDMRAKGMIPTDPREMQENLVAGIPKAAPRQLLGNLNTQRLLNVNVPDLGEKSNRRVAGAVEQENQPENPFARRFSNAERAPHVTAFLNRMERPAVMAGAESGVHPSLILAQAALETGWGKERIPTRSGADSHNIFGIKAGDYWNGPTTDVMTTEYVDGQPQKRVERFRVYSSDEEAFSDYARLLSKNPRYQGVVNARSGEAAAVAIQRAGYATDPEYASKLISVMSNIGQISVKSAVVQAEEIPFGSNIW